MCGKCAGVEPADVWQLDWHTAAVSELEFTIPARCCPLPAITTGTQKTVLGKTLAANQTIVQDLDGAIDIISITRTSARLSPQD